MPTSSSRTPTGPDAAPGRRPPPGADVSVLIVNYFCHRLTHRAVQSVLADAPRAEVIVVDNSADAAEAQALAALLPQQVSLVQPGENLGFGRACNLAWAGSSRPWVMLLNPDAAVLPGCLDALANTMQSRPGAGAVAPLVHWDEASGFLLPPQQIRSPLWECWQSLGLRVPALGRLISRRFRAENLRCQQAQGAISQAMLSGGCMMLRRSAVEAVQGLFDPEFFMYYEDADLCRRLTSAGYLLLLQPQARALHEWRNDPAKGRFVADSRRHFIAKHYSGWSWVEQVQRWIEARMPVRGAFAGLRDLGALHAGSALSLGEDSGRWTLEISPHPLLVPAALCFGQGPAQVSPQVLSLLHAGRCFARLTTSDGRQSVYAWELQPNGAEPAV
jgi:GT2 family glycosyltransferase